MLFHLSGLFHCLLCKMELDWLPPGSKMLEVFRKRTDVAAAFSGRAESGHENSALRPALGPTAPTAPTQRPLQRPLKKAGSLLGLCCMVFMRPEDPLSSMLQALREALGRVVARLCFVSSGLVQLWEVVTFRPTFSEGYYGPLTLGLGANLGSLWTDHIFISTSPPGAAPEPCGSREPSTVGGSFPCHVPGSMPRAGDVSCGPHSLAGVPQSS